MKKLFTLSLIFIALGRLSAQAPTMEIRNTADNSVVSTGNTFYKTTTALTGDVYIYTIKNISPSTQTFNFNKTDVLMNYIGTADSAYAYLCTGIYCYPSTMYTAAITLTTSEVMTLRFDFEEASVIGLSTVKYSIQNASSSETFSVTFKYNDIVGLNSPVSSNTIHSPVYPNPGSQAQFFKVNSTTEGSMTYSIQNALGQKVKEVTKNIISGENIVALDTEGLESGIYYLNVNQGEQQFCEKFVVIQ